MDEKSGWCFHKCLVVVCHFSFRKQTFLVGLRGILRAGAQILQDTPAFIHSTYNHYHCLVIKILALVDISLSFLIVSCFLFPSRSENHLEYNEQYLFSWDSQMLVNSVSFIFHISIHEFTISKQVEQYAPILIEFSRILLLSATDLF